MEEFPVGAVGVNDEALREMDPLGVLPGVVFSRSSRELEGVLDLKIIPPNILKIDFALSRATLLPFRRALTLKFVRTNSRYSSFSHSRIFPTRPTCSKIPDPSLSAWESRPWEAISMTRSCSIGQNPGEAARALLMCVMASAG